MSNREKTKYVVRLVEDTDIGYYWFERKLSNGQWVEISDTRSRCEGNTRFGLKEWLNKERDRELMIFRKYSEEEEYEL